VFVEILTIGLILVCAALWRDVANLRARLKLLEESVLPPVA
jgi:hypothetical protein